MDVALDIALDIALEVALDVVLDVALGAVGALGVDCATGGSLRIAIGGIRDHWIRDCFHSRSFSSISGCFGVEVSNVTHFSGRHLKAKGNRWASILVFGSG